jgi:predicted aspartyl protease
MRLRFAPLSSLMMLLCLGTVVLGSTVPVFQRSYELPAAVGFREDRSRGLLVDTWINGAGPFVFAIDTGAGVTILSERVANEARLAVSGPRAAIGGLSGASTSTAQPVAIDTLALGAPDNRVPGRGAAIVSNGIPSGVDGVLDPTEAYSPLGYVIDLPNSELRAFDPKSTPIRRSEVPPGGAVVSWDVDGESRRPYVRLSDGQRALVDTGSRFGLAIGEAGARAMGLDLAKSEDRGDIRDFGGATIRVRRIRPITIEVGALTLAGIPTDVLSGAHAEAPTLLGRDALRPFLIAFDPLNKLVAFAPARN